MFLADNRDLPALHWALYAILFLKKEFRRAREKVITNQKYI